MRLQRRVARLDEPLAFAFVTDHRDGASGARLLSHIRTPCLLDDVAAVGRHVLRDGLCSNGARLGPLAFQCFLCFARHLPRASLSTPVLVGHQVLQALHHVSAAPVPHHGPEHPRRNSGHDVRLCVFDPQVRRRVAAVCGP